MQVPTGTVVPYLYILARTDLDSMNPGKMAAQVAHAANDFIFQLQKKVQTIDSASASLWKARYDAWRYDDVNAKMLTFGTTIVMNGIDGDTIHDIVYRINDSGGDHLAGTITDPTYPIRDGKITHYLPLLTTGWVFCKKDDPAWVEASRRYDLRLHK